VLRARLKFWWDYVFGREPQKWLAIMLPLLLLAANGSWLWDSPRYFDTNVYIGFFKHYLEFKMPYVANYKSSRLPFVLPGALLYGLLPGAVAHHLLHLGFLTVEALAVYSMVRRRFGGRAAYVTVAALVTSTFSHTLTSYHNQAATTYFILALFALEWPARAPWPARFGGAGALYAMGLTTDSVLGLLGPFLALHAVGALPRPLRVSRLLLAGVIVPAGGVAAIGLIGALNVTLGGPFLFFVEQLRYSTNIAKSHGMSRIPVAAIPREIFQLPMLAVPAVIGVGSFALLLRSAWRRRWGWATAEAAGYLMSLGFAAVGQARGLGVLDLHVLFQVFSAPMYLALGALLGRFGARGDGWIGWRFAAVVAFLSVAPLALAGDPASRLLLRVGRVWPAATYGVPFVFILALLAAGVAWWRRARNPTPAIVVAAALGLANPLCTEPTQPANLYQVGRECPFRSEVFAAVLEVDAVISEFDPKNEANWASAAPALEEPGFDGHDFCHQLPAETAARAALLTHYFYTSDELIYGAVAHPAKKVMLVATSPAQLKALEASAQTGIPAGSRLRPAVVRSFPHSTFTLVVGGYEVVATSS